MNKNIVISAPVYSLSGYGAHSRDIITSLWDSGLFNIKAIANGWGASSNINTLSPSTKDVLEYVTDVNNLKKDSIFTYIHVGIPPEFKPLSKTMNIGITAGLEADYIPKTWVEGCHKMNLIIVPSKFVKNIFIKSGVKTRIEVVSEGVDTSIFNPQAPPLPLEIPGSPSFTFLTIGQWLDLEVGRDRKQLGLLLELFLTIFKDNPNVNLIMKSYINNHSSSDGQILKERIKELKESISSKANIYLLHGELSDQELAGLYTNPNINAFISLTSGEGWGRPIAESLSCELPVIVTGWSGHMDFVNENYSVALPYKLGKVPKGLFFFEPGMQWAYVDIAAVSNVMLRLVNDSSFYSSLTSKAREFGDSFRKTYDKKIKYQKLIQLLTEGD